MGSAELDVIVKDIQSGNVKLKDDGIQSQTRSMVESSGVSVEEINERSQTSIWVTFRAYRPVVLWSLFICLAALMWGYDSLVSRPETNDES